MSKAGKTTFDVLRRLALALPDVEEGLSYGTPALKVKGKLFVRLRDDLDAVVVKMPFAKRDELLAADPETYFLTDHYVPYEWILVRLAAIRTEALPELLQTAYATAAAEKGRR